MTAKPECFEAYPSLSPAAAKVVESIQGRTVCQAALRRIEDQLETLSGFLLHLNSRRDSASVAKLITATKADIDRLELNHRRLSEGRCG